MKTKLLLMLLAIALVAGVAHANMLKNPGFEEGSFQTKLSPEHWENYYTTYGQVHTWINSAAGAHSGSKYIKMYNWLYWATTYSTSAYLGQEVLGVKEGRDYTFSVWAKNGVEDQVRLANIYIDWLDSAAIGDPNLSPDDDAIDADSVNIPVTDANWVEVDFGTFTAPEGAVAAWVYLGAPLENDLRAIFYDDVSMLGADPNITAGVDMISWDGQTLSLTGTTSLDGYSTITWSAEPAYAAVITAGDTLTPTVDVDCIIPSGPATIANHSFENDLPVVETDLDNWEIIAGEGHDTWGGYDANDVLTVFVTPTDGRMCVYVDGVSDGMGKLSQVLVNTLAANTDYTLSVDVVNDGYYKEDVAYRVQLCAGGSILAQDNDGQALDDYGVWATSTVNFSTGDDHAQLGEQLEIRLVAKTGTARMNFDNVRLTANPPFPAHVPDVLTIKMKLDIDGKYDTMMIDTYPDACAAWLAAGLREPTDLVGDECITNVADLAEVVKTWTEDNAFTEPFTRPAAGAKHEDIFSINFYFADYVFMDWEEEDLLTIMLEEDEFAGFDTWLIDGWTNISVLWDDFIPQPIGGSSNLASSSTFTLVNNRNGWAVNEDPVENGIGNYEMMNATAWGTEDSDQGVSDLPNEIIDILVEDIPIDKYDVIVYVTGHRDDELFGYEQDRTGKFVFNGVEQDITTMKPPFAGNFVEITDSTTPGNFLCFRDVTGDSFSIQMWGNGWNHIGICGLQWGGADQLYPSPPDGGFIQPASDLELSWANTEPNKPGDPLYVDVWFGTEPNDLPPPDPDYDFNKIVDAVEDANSVTVDVSALDTYYWQVNWYIYGSPTGDPIESRLLSFSTVTDAPVSVNAGGDMLTWSGRKVQLDGSIDDDGTSGLTIGWSADPPVGVSWPDGTDVLDPNVVITKVTDNPSVVTLVLSAQDAVSSDVDTLKIDVYDNPCLAAIGEGQEYDAGDFDEDCDTDLEDYATIAEEWLVYNELTTSVVKP